MRRKVLGRHHLDGDHFVTVGVDGPSLSVQFRQGGPQSRVLPENPTIRGPGREMVAEKVASPAP